jgi:transcriptional regulator with XRE-family HTH domain
MSNDTTSYGRILLERELARRCSKNPSYSLRAFAKALGISHSLLSLILAGKRTVTKALAREIAEHLSISPEDQHNLLSQPRPVEPDRTFQLEVDAFSFIADWQNFALLSLLEIKDAQWNSKWISRALRISEAQAKLTMDRLERLGYVVVHRGQARLGTPPIRIENTVSTPATRRFHRGLLERAVESLENDPMEARDFSSMTFAMDPALVGYALKKIRDFRRKLSQDLETRGEPKEVYNLTVQLFPVSQIHSKQPSKENKR